MPAQRKRALIEPITLWVDGKKIEAEQGEPVAMAIAASGRLLLSHSPKYHRPRGASCYRGRCDGCLMRVDGRPSVVTCREPAREGMRVQTQNTVGGARNDLLRVIDWFYPGGMDHHHMMTWSQPANRLMSKIAERLAGLGRLPETPAKAALAGDRRADVLIVGAGPAGLTAARACAESGLHVIVVDEEQRAGGSLLWECRDVALSTRAPGPGADVANNLATEAERAGAELVLGVAAIGVYREPVDGLGIDVSAEDREAGAQLLLLADEPEGALLFRPKTLVLATGRNLGAVAIEGADLPGIIDVDAALRMVAHGIAPGKEVLLLGEGRALESLAVGLRKLGVEVLGPYPERVAHSFRGRTVVRTCLLDLKGQRKKVRCDAVVLSPQSSAVYELAAQAGVQTHIGLGVELAVDFDTGATARPDVFVIGAAAGALGLEQSVSQAERMAVALSGGADER